jgi:hypothetical protein
MGGYSYKKRNKAVKQSFKNRRSSPRNINIMVGGEEPSVFNGEDNEMVGGTLEDYINRGFVAIDNYFKIAYIRKYTNNIYIEKEESIFETLHRETVLAQYNVNAKLELSIANVIQKAFDALTTAAEAAKRGGTGAGGNPTGSASGVAPAPVATSATGTAVVPGAAPVATSATGTAVVPGAAPAPAPAPAAEVTTAPAAEVTTAPAAVLPGAASQKTVTEHDVRDAIVILKTNSESKTTPFLEHLLAVITATLAVLVGDYKTNRTNIINMQKPAEDLIAAINNLNDVIAKQ